MSNIFEPIIKYTQYILDSKHSGVIESFLFWFLSKYTLYRFHNNNNNNNSHLWPIKI